MIRKPASLLIAGAFLSACATAPKIHIEDAWARPAEAGVMTDMSAEMPATPAGDANSAAYFVIVNDGNEADILTGVETLVAGSAEMHETKIENDIAQMLPVFQVDIPAHGRVEFKPAGYHVMLLGLKQDLKEGDSFQLRLLFVKSGAITVEALVRAQ